MRIERFGWMSWGMEVSVLSDLLLFYDTLSLLYGLLLLLLLLLRFPFSYLLYTKHAGLTCLTGHNQLVSHTPVSLAMLRAFGI